MPPFSQLPSPVKTFHNKPYPAIDPTLPANTAKGKSIVITGGGTGIGRATALAFSAAGASHIALFGRRLNKLNEVKAELNHKFPDVKITTASVDVTDKSAVDKAIAAFASTVGKPLDSLISNAGYQPNFKKVVDESNFDDWWSGFEINVKGAWNVVSSFVKHAKEDADLINVSTAAVPLLDVPGISGYGASKAAAAKMFQVLAAEHPETFVYNVHPGTVETDMLQKTTDAGVHLPVDDANLSAHFMVYLVSRRAPYLRSRFLWCNWDVEELEQKYRSVLEKSRGLFTMANWGLQPPAKPRLA